MSVNSISYQTLANFLSWLRKQKPVDLKLSQKEFDEYSNFLFRLSSDVYIECSKCQKMIAPNEMYEIENEEAVCEECSGK